MNPAPAPARKRFLLKKKVVEADVLTLARERVAHTFDLFDTVSVSFSGGKDSTACLHLALDEATKRNRLPLDVIFLDEEAIPWQTVEYVARCMDRPDIRLRWYCTPVKHRNGCSHKEPWWYVWDPRIPEKWVRPYPTERAWPDPKGFKHGMTWPDMAGLCYPPDEFGTVGVIMGIRGQESLTRQRAVSHRVDDNYLIPYNELTSRKNVTKSYPIYDWCTEDVWTYPNKMGYDYNRAYDLLEKAGLDHHAQRCAPPFGEEPMRGLWTFKVCFPEIWDKMHNRVPGAATAARYSSTAIYAYGGLPTKSPSISWEEFILLHLSKFNPEDKAFVASRLKQEIKVHYSKTRDPILYSVKHPITGLSWKFLLNIAVRGDFKGRKIAGQGIPTEEKDKAAAFAKYNAALIKYRAGDDYA